MGFDRKRLAVAAAVACASLGTLAGSTGSALASQSASFTCTLQGTANLTPSVAPSGGAGTYAFNGQMLQCASGPPANYVPYTDEPFTSSGTYTSNVCGDANLTGTYTFGKTGHQLSGKFSLNDVAGVGTVTLTVDRVDTGATTGPTSTTSSQGTGLVGVLPTTTTPGPSDCADSLTVGGQLAVSFTF